MPQEVPYRTNQHGPRWIVAAALLAGVALSPVMSCHKAYPHDFGSGFRVVSRRSGVDFIGDAPIRWSDILEMRRFWGWKQLAVGGFDVESLDGGILVRGQFDQVHDGAPGTVLRIYRNGSERYTDLPEGRCRWTIRTRNRRGVMCVDVRRLDPVSGKWTDDRSFPEVVHVERFDLYGRLVEQLTADLALQPPNIDCDYGIKATTSDEIVLSQECSLAHMAPRPEGPPPHFEETDIVTDGALKPLPPDAVLESDKDRDDEFDRRKRAGG